MSLVSFVGVSNLEYSSIKKAIIDSLNLIHFNFERKCGKIVIKPNMCYYYPPSTGEVTDPLFVSVMIDIFRENLGDPEIFIVESDASAMRCKQSFTMLGYEKMAEQKNVKLINLSKEKFDSIDVKLNNFDFKFLVPKIFKQSDLVVNVPKSKYMKEVKISCALKNMFGCNAYSRKHIYHKALNESIVTINKLIKTDLVVLDGLVVSGKNTKQLNLVMSSEDPVGLDAATSMLMGLNPKSIRHIVLAAKEGIGNIDFIPVGDFHYYEKEFPKKSYKDNIWDNAASLYLSIFK